MSIPPPGQLVDVVGHRLHSVNCFALEGCRRRTYWSANSGATGVARLVVSVVSRGGLLRAPLELDGRRFAGFAEHSDSPIKPVYAPRCLAVGLARQRDCISPIFVPDATACSFLTR